MTVIAVDRFGGMAPRLSRRLLDPSQAAFATNCRLTSGDLTPFRQSGLRKTFTGLTVEPNRVFRELRADGSEVWIPLPGLSSSLVNSPITNDSFERVYWTQPNLPPRVSTLAWFAAYELNPGISPTGSVFNLGVERPGSPPLVSASGGSSPNTESRAYVYTFRTAFGEESAPSEPVVIENKPDAVYTVSGWPSTPPSDYPNVSKVAIYRTVVGQTQADFFFVGEQLLGISSFRDIAPSLVTAQNNLLESLDWDVPPSSLQGLKSHAGGFLVGFTGRDVWFSEPYRPHAWPAAYTLTMRDKVIAVEPLADGVIVLTTSGPVALTGSKPSSLSVSRFNVAEPCLSARSVVAVENTVLYASPNGMIAVTLGSVQNVTSQLVTREEWLRDFTPAAITACRYGPYYLAFISASRGWVMAFGAEAASLCFLDRLADVDGVDTDRYDGRAFIVSNNRVFEFDAAEAEPMQLTWASKEFVLPKPQNMAAFQILFDDEEQIEDIDTGELAVLAYNRRRLEYELDTIGLYGIARAYTPIGRAKVRVFNRDVLPPLQPLGGTPLLNVDELLVNRSTRLKVTADDKVIYNEAIQDQKTKKLPSGFKATRWAFEVQSIRTIDVIAIATSAAEIGKV